MTTAVLRSVSFASAMVLAGCGDSRPPDRPGGSGGAGSGGDAAQSEAGEAGEGNDAGAVADAGPVCPPGSGVDLGIANHANEGYNHITACSATNYQTNPPSSGNHYPSWPAYKTYAQPVPWGFLMHGLEHGAVVIGYNCPEDCPTEIAAAQTWIDALPAADPLCPEEKPRVILAPNPALDVRWAASAWGWTLRFCAFESTLFQQFFAAHYNQTHEKICRSGSELDRSAIRWCP